MMQTESLHEFSVSALISIYLIQDVTPMWSNYFPGSNGKIIFFFNILREFNKLLDHCILSAWFATELNLAETNLYERHIFWKAV